MGPPPRMGVCVNMDDTFGDPPHPDGPVWRLPSHLCSWGWLAALTTTEGNSSSSPFPKTFPSSLHVLRMFPV